MALTDFYHIETLSFNDSAIDAVLTLNTLHAIYNGHFPEKPIVPGVCQVQMLKQLVEKALNKPFVMVDAKEIKFLNMILPNESARLQCHVEIGQSVDNRMKMTANISCGDTTMMKLKATLECKA